MTIDLRCARMPQASEKSAFSFGPPAARAAPVGRAELNYSDVELSQAAEASDFDAQTIAIVGGIVIFKLSMLGLLLMSL